MTRRIGGRAGRLWLGIAGACAAALAAAALPVPAGFAEGDRARLVTFAALASGALVALVILPFVVWKGQPRRAIWLATAAVALVLGVLAFYAADATQRQCTARSGGRTVIVGTELTQLGSDYQRANPDLSRDDLLADSPGRVDRVWTRGSIDRCRRQIAATYFLWIPLLVVCVLATVAAIPGGMLPVPIRATSAPASPATPELRYDVFLSYRHGGRDTQVARALLETLEADGYRVAIDDRDFPANASFLEEMERCIRESRFTLAIISPAYLESGNCQEEAIITKVLDMGERRRRLIPFVIEPVTMPVWLYGIVGIDYTKADPLVDALAKLEGTLGPPLAAREPAQ
jgi:hypothetical protein